MATMAVAGYRPLHRIGLVVFPEFAWCPPLYERREDLLKHQALEVPNDLTDKLVRCARDLGVYVQAGSLIERDPRWPELAFNTTLLIGPEGIVSRYRKVNPWIPWEVHASPADVPGYPDPLFPVAETAIGRIGVATDLGRGSTFTLYVPVWRAGRCEENFEEEKQDAGATVGG